MRSSGPTHWCGPTRLCGQTACLSPTKVFAPDVAKRGNNAQVNHLERMPFDTLKCKLAPRDDNHLLPGLNIKVGERISGWKGANRGIAGNFDASLDLFSIAASFTP